MATIFPRDVCEKMCFAWLSCWDLKKNTVPPWPCATWRSGEPKKMDPWSLVLILQDLRWFSPQISGGWTKTSWESAESPKLLDLYPSLSCQSLIKRVGPNAGVQFPSCLEPRDSPTLGDLLDQIEPRVDVEGIHPCTMAMAIGHGELPKTQPNINFSWEDCVP